MPFIWGPLHKILVNTCKLYLFNSFLLFFYPFYAFNLYDFMTINIIEQ